MKNFKLLHGYEGYTYSSPIDRIERQISILNDAFVINGVMTGNITNPLMVDIQNQISYLREQMIQATMIPRRFFNI